MRLLDHKLRCCCGVNDGSFMCSNIYSGKITKIIWRSEWWTYKLRGFRFSRASRYSTPKQVWFILQSVCSVTVTISCFFHDLTQGITICLRRAFILKTEHRLFCSFHLPVIDSMFFLILYSFIYHNTRWTLTLFTKELSVLISKLNCSFSQTKPGEKLKLTRYRMRTIHFNKHVDE